MSNLLGELDRMTTSLEGIGCLDTLLQVCILWLDTLLQVCILWLYTFSAVPAC